MTATDKVSVLLVGIGGYGASYLDALLDEGDLRGAELVGAVDPKPHARRLPDLKQRRIPLYSELSEFYDAGGQAQLVVIAAPIHFHLPFTTLALENGASVLCEKPIASTIQDARAMADAERRNTGFVAIGFQWSFAAAIQSLKSDILAGTLGKPLRLTSLVCWPRTAAYYARNDWAGVLKSADGQWILDSPVSNATAHFLHNALYVLGDAPEHSAHPVKITAELYRANHIGNYDTAALRCLTAGDAEILHFSSHAVPSGLGPVLRYEFEDGVVLFDGNCAEMTASMTDGSIRQYGSPDWEPMAKLWQSTAMVATGKGAPVCGLPAAMAHILCANGAHESCPEIGTFEAGLLHTIAGEEASLTWVDGLLECFVQCSWQNLLPSEHPGISWGRPGKPFDLTDYNSFPKNSVGT